jgi:REP element-mobilizing transposase RayT
MGRALRSHLPGGIFHLTTRVQGHEPLLVGLEARIVALLHATAPASDARLLAYAVMPNHLHILLLQGDQPLSSFMQPLLCRIALLVQRRRGREGHVFERRYRDAHCGDVMHVRNAVAYIHLNPVRAGICASPDEYAWSSQRVYSGVAPSSLRLRESVDSVLRLFEPAAAPGRAAALKQYAAFLRWRVEYDRYRDAGDDVGAPLAPAPPDLRGGDRHWLLRTNSETAVRPRRRVPSPDISDIARQVLSDMAPEADLDWLRSGERHRQLVATRRAVIVRALDAGHAPRSIARYLRVSLQVISSVAAALRDVRQQAA